MATTQQRRDVDAWLDQYAVATAEANARTAAAVAAAYSGIDDWFNPSQTVPAAMTAAQTVRAAQRMHSGLMSEFIAFAIQLLTGRRPPTPSLRTPLEYPRRGVRDVDVYSRPVFKAREALDKGLEQEMAEIEAQVLAEILAETDMLLTRRDTGLSVMESAGVERYRRVVRPELSRTGVCGLCIAAATRVYTTDELLPIHTRCKCTVLPIVDDFDPGDINAADLEKVYAEIPATNRRQLSTFRYKVQDNGELGPVLEPDAKQKSTVPRADTAAPELQTGGSGGQEPPTPLPSGATGGEPDEYPALPDGSRVPFSPTERPKATVADRNRILSKHRHGANLPGKTMFPDTWSDDDIMDAVDQTVARPDPGGITRSGDKITFDKRIDGHLVRVHVRVDVDPPILWSAYPPEGTLSP